MGAKSISKWEFQGCFGAWRFSCDTCLKIYLLVGDVYKYTVYLCKIGAAAWPWASCCQGTWWEGTADATAAGSLSWAPKSFITKLHLAQVINPWNNWLCSAGLGGRGENWGDAEVFHQSCCVASDLAWVSLSLGFGWNMLELFSVSALLVQGWRWNGSIGDGWVPNSTRELLFLWREGSPCTWFSTCSYLIV